MYAIRKTTSKGVSFRTYDGWTPVAKATDVLELGEVQRFTKREALDYNLLPKGEEFVWFGCYKEL